MKEQVQRFHCERFDVYVNVTTGDYLERKCKDPECCYCSKRPEKLINTCRRCRFEFNDGTFCKGYKNESETTRSGKQ